MASEIAIQTGGGALDLVAAVTPEGLAQAIARESALRSVITGYVKDNLVEGHHYYYLNSNSKSEGAKPGIAKEGALNICSLFKVTPIPQAPVLTFDAEGHMTVQARVDIVNREGALVASGAGMASTRESKYAAQKKWLWESKLPAGVSKEDLPREERTNQKGVKYFVYQLETTSNPADHYNTVLKMAEKRALVGACTHLPLVSELFTTGLTPGDDDATRAYVAAQDTRPRKEKNITPPRKEKLADVTRKTAGLDELIRELRDAYGIAPAEIQARMKALTGVDKRADLNEGQMIACLEAFEVWTNELDAIAREGNN